MSISPAIPQCSLNPKIMNRPVISQSAPGCKQDYCRDVLTCQLAFDSLAKSKRIKGVSRVQGSMIKTIKSDAESSPLNGMDIQNSDPGKWDIDHLSHFIITLHPYQGYPRLRRRFLQPTPHPEHRTHTKKGGLTWDDH